MLEMRGGEFSLERACDYLTLLLIALLHMFALQAQPFLVMRILQSALRVHAINKNSRGLQSSRFNISSLCRTQSAVLYHVVWNYSRDIKYSLECSKIVSNF